MSDKFQIIEGDNLEALRGMADLSCSVCITDPPYAEETHEGARTCQKEKGKIVGEATKLVSFAPISMVDLRTRLDEIGRITTRWTVATMDWRHIYQFEKEPPAHMRFVRFGIWYKPNGAPQFTGDRPSTGWEGVAHLHRAGGAMQWNGGGYPGFYQHNIETFGLYPTQKPISLLREFVRLFTDPDDLVIDPFCGSGTTGVACMIEGRRFIGIDSDPYACELAHARISRAIGVYAKLPPKRNRAEHTSPLFDLSFTTHADREQEAT